MPNQKLTTEKPTKNDTREIEVAKFLERPDFHSIALSALAKGAADAVRAEVKKSG